MCEIVCVKEIICRSLAFVAILSLFFFFFHNKEDRGGFPVIVMLCRELRVAY